MKKIAFIITILFSLLAITSCENASVKNLKKQVASLDAICPINAGIGGDFLSVKYNETDGNVYMYFATNEELGNQFFLKENRKNIKENLKLMFMSGDAKQMLDDMVKANAGLVLTYKLPSTGKTAKFVITADELKEVRDNPMSDYDRIMIMVQNKLAAENSRCPYSIGDGMVMAKVAIADDNLVYYIQVDENLYDFSQWKNSKDELRSNLEETFKEMRNDLTMQSEFKLMRSARLGCQYRYFGSKSKDYIDIVISLDELDKYIK